MRELHQTFGSRRIFLLSVAAIVTFGVPIVFGPARATSAQTPPQAQSINPSDFKYDVASIKPSKPRTGGGMFVTGMRETPDGLVATNAPLLFLVQNAYIVNPFQISGAPGWLSADRYDVDARMDSSTIEALEKLTPDERKLARQKMLQALLADRIKLQVHRDSKESPVFSLVIAKNGPKLQEAKPAAIPTTSANDASGPAGGRSSGMGMSAGNEDGMSIATFRESPIDYLVGWLAANLRTRVTDKTGLTGVYNFKLKWTPERRQSAVPSTDNLNGQPPAAADPVGPTLLEAIEDQLGLKLISEKGSVEGIVIDHIEKPSPN